MCLLCSICPFFGGVSCKVSLAFHWKLQNGTYEADTHDKGIHVIGKKWALSW